MGVCSLSQSNNKGIAERTILTQLDTPINQNSEKQINLSSQGQRMQEDKSVNEGEESNKIYQPSMNNSIKLLNIVIQIGHQKIDMNQVQATLRISEFKKQILSKKKDQIIKYLKLDTLDNFELWYNNAYLQNDVQLAHYELDDKEIKLVSVVAIRVKIEERKQECWIRKMFLSQKWQQLKEKMAKDLSIQPSQITCTYKKKFVNMNQSLLSDSFMDGEEVLLTIQQ